MIDDILDASIIFSFDHSGFIRHCPTSLEKVNLRGKNGIITGASSGIGLSVATILIEQGMSCQLISRNEKNDPNFHSLDMSNLKDVKAFASKVNEPVDLIVHNAGSMPPTLTMTQEGHEHVFATQILGPFHLTKILADQGKLNPECRIIFVSSGGMYLKKLDLSDLLFSKSPYNKYTAYANAKRAQVDLVELFAKHYPGYLFSSMHPGWVDTPGVESSMPLFRKLLDNRLRTPDEGADTILWLATTSDYPNGKFWFDRKEAKTTFFNLFQSTQEDKDSLWLYCEST